MQFVWAGNRTEKYSRRSFSINLVEECDKIVICAVDFYRVFFDGKFFCYGPERTASGYSRKRELAISGIKNIVVEVAGYNHQCYACDLQQPFLAQNYIVATKWFIIQRTLLVTKGRIGCLTCLGLVGNEQRLSITI